MTATPKTLATTGLAGGNNADTYGWDTAFAINFNNANAALTAAWPNVNPGAKNLSQAASDDPDYNINAVLGPWQLTVGGDGKNIRMACPIASGTYNAGSHQIPLAGTNTQVVIEVGVAIVRPAEFVVFKVTQWMGPTKA